MYLILGLFGGFCIGCIFMMFLLVGDVEYERKEVKKMNNEVLQKAFNLLSQEFCSIADCYYCPVYDKCKSGKNTSDYYIRQYILNLVEERTTKDE